jgi:threonine dehydrogenase-like Zn-dependent dehydrogenase
MNNKGRSMRAAILAAPAQARVQRTARPEVTDRTVRVRLHGCGVCGSNLAPWEGRPWFAYPFEPGAPGHEGWGEVDSVGALVSRVRVGDRVAILSHNAFAEFDMADETAVVPLPAEFGNRPFPGEAIGCVMNIFKRCQIERGQTVAIVGVGFLGALLTTLCTRAGARVLAISRRPFSLEIAKTLGAAETIPLNDRWQVVKAIIARTDGQGCERVIEATGRQEPLDIAAEITRERGRLIIAGYHQDGSRQVNMQMWNWRGLDVINAHERDPAVYVSGIHDAVEAVHRREIDPTILYTHSWPLDRISDAFNTMRDRPASFLKGLVQL